MSERRKKSGLEKSGLDDNDSENRPSGSGRVAFDERGNPIWEWETQTGMFSTDITTQRMRKLEAPDLSIDETGKFTKPNLGIAQKLPGGGANPYDQQFIDKRDKGPRTKTLASRVADARKAATPPAPPPSRWAFLKKLFGRR